MTYPRHVLCEGADLIPASEHHACAGRATATLRGVCPTGHPLEVEVCEAHKLVLAGGQVACPTCADSGRPAVSILLSSAIADGAA
ncbi:hypothetical protein AB0M43_37660 [Longispora sp. NPDC051575]|uniref:hypothetical protein n=1 Tax=Longispora sp. NPDC051575 TaxID=3154943 RepID=UPI00342DD0DD